MTFEATFDDSVEAQIDEVAEIMGLCRTDAIRHVLAVGLFLYREKDKGSKVIVKRRFRRHVEVML